MNDSVKGNVHARIRAWGQRATFDGSLEAAACSKVGPSHMSWVTTARSFGGGGGLGFFGSHRTAEDLG